MRAVRLYAAQTSIKKIAWWWCAVLCAKQPTWTHKYLIYLSVYYTHTEACNYLYDSRPLSNLAMLKGVCVCVCLITMHNVFVYVLQLCETNAKQYFCTIMQSEAHTRFAPFYIKPLNVLACLQYFFKLNFYIFFVICDAFIWSYTACAIAGR